VAKHESRDNGAQPAEVGRDSRQVVSDCAGQSGGHSRTLANRGCSRRSVEELADIDQACEAEVIGGVEDAADHPEKPVRIKGDFCAIR
jgi:hypothetical protein